MSDALLAVVVEAREDLGVAEVFLTNRAGDLLLKLFHPLLHGIRGFRHRNFSSRKRNTAIKAKKGLEQKNATSYAHTDVVRMCKTFQQVSFPDHRSRTLKVRFLHLFASFPGLPRFLFFGLRSVALFRFRVLY